MLRQLTFAAALLAACGTASAGTASINFSGTVSSTCALTVTNGSGVLAPSATLGNLSSRNAGGTPGAITVNTTGGVNLSVDPVTSPVQPAADVSTTVWTPTFRMAGMQTIPDTAATTPLASSGTGNVSVDLTATKTGADSFKPGTYGAVVTVRCEP